MSDEHCEACLASHGKHVMLKTAPPPKVSVGSTPASAPAPVPDAATTPCAIFGCEPFSIRVGVHVIMVAPPKSDGQPLVIKNAGHTGTTLTVVNARAHARGDPDRFELQVKNHAPHVTLFKSDHPNFCKWIKEARAMPLTFSPCV